MTGLVHVANVILLLSYSVRDILWLRVLSVLAGGVFIAYFFSLPEPLYAAAGWNAVFTCVNGWRIWRLFLERRPVHLSAEENELRRLAFRSLSRRELRTLVGLAQWS